jgi:putative FmdB family regulatory protein
MNIFYLSNDINEIASYHCDKHLNKMLLESCQMISTAIRYLDPAFASHYPLLYKSTHVNHPCSKWTRYSSQNFIWHMIFIYTMNMEFKSRFKKFNDHMSYVKIYQSGLNFINSYNWTIINYTNHPLCMDDKYKSDNLVQSYRNYYISKWYDFREKNQRMRWTTRPVPDWFQKGLGMPTYTYTCNNCAYTFSECLPIDERYKPEGKCLKCGEGEIKKVIESPQIVDPHHVDGLHKNSQGFKEVLKKVKQRYPKFESKDL